MSLRLLAPSKGRSGIARFHSRSFSPNPQSLIASDQANPRFPTYLYDAEPRVFTTPRHFAYVKVAEGCDYKCSFCIIPTLRGHYRSRPVDAIVREARSLAARGVRELILISQDTTFYGRDLGEGAALPTLLRELNEIDGIDWIRLLYLYPTTITDEMLEAMADCDKVVKYIDLPLQHASDDVLRRMKRPGTGKGYEKLLARIRERVPGVSLRTTFIVGFPGETAAEFEELRTFIQRIGFDHVGVFTYSHEEGTTAHDFADDVPAATKRKRRNALMAEQKRIVARAQKVRVGAQVDVMVDGPSPEHELVWRGRLAGQAPEIDPVVYFTDANPDALRPGALLRAEIVGAREYRFGGASTVINFQVRKSLQDLKWAGAHFLFLRVVLRSSLTEFASLPSGWPAPTIWRFSTFSSGESLSAGC